ncbi:hypothetical protein BDW22DRAFT_348830 [Trametopsis cervina]|nr:hypothetical protein BDW22DRAFT_348830 [Trametopsis cervina]
MGAPCLLSGPRAIKSVLMSTTVQCTLRPYIARDQKQNKHGGQPPTKPHPTLALLARRLQHNQPARRSPSRDRPFHRGAARRRHHPPHHRAELVHAANRRVHGPVLVRERAPEHVPDHARAEPAEEGDQACGLAERSLHTRVPWLELAGRRDGRGLGEGACARDEGQAVDVSAPDAECGGTHLHTHGLVNEDDAGRTFLTALSRCRERLAFVYIVSRRLV